MTAILDVRPTLESGVELHPREAARLVPRLALALRQPQCPRLLCRWRPDRDGRLACVWVSAP
jgi:hypothetical protein